MRVSRRVVLLAGAGAVLPACGSAGPSAGSAQEGSFVSRRRVAPAELTLAAAHLGR